MELKLQKYTIDLLNFQKPLFAILQNQNHFTMKLGAFSVSLSVKDLSASKAFYEKLGFQQFAGDMKRNYLIMKNEDTLLGLFQGMFENNILTFNPGWNTDAQLLEQYDDVRAIKSELKNDGVDLLSEADPSKQGPVSITLMDPDGNVILIDQHV